MKRKKDKVEDRNNSKLSKAEVKGSKYYTSAWSWVLTVILMLIPVVNIIYFIGLIIGIGKQSKVAWARANLLVLLLVALGFFIYGLIFFGGFDNLVTYITEMYQSFIEWLTTTMEQIKASLGK